MSWSIGRTGHRREDTGGGIPRPAGTAREAAHLGRLEVARPAAPQAVDPDRPDPDADEAVDRGADRGEHPAELAFPALAQGRSVPGQRRWRRIEQAAELVDLHLGHRPQVEERRQALVDGDPGVEGAPLLRVERNGQPDRVLALDAEPGMEHPLRPRPVVREDQQPFRVQVEPADGVQPGPVRHERGRQEVEDGGRRVPVAGRRRDAAGLVEEEVRRAGGRADLEPVDLDQGLLGVDLLAERRPPPVDSDPTGGDEVLAGAATRDAGGGKDLLEPLGRHQVPTVSAGVGIPRRPARLPRPPRRAGRPPRRRAGAARRGS